MTYGGRVINMKVSLFDTLSMVALWISESKQAFLEIVTVVSQQQLTCTCKVKTDSFSFQKEKAMFSKPCVSETPAIPSSPQRYVRERACSWGKSRIAGLWSVHILDKARASYDMLGKNERCVGDKMCDGLTTPGIAIGRVVFTNYRVCQ